MINIIYKFTKSVDFVVDPFKSTCSVEMACMSLPEHKKVVVSDKDNSCLDHSINLLVALFSPQILNPNSDSDGRDHERLHAMKLLRALDEIYV